MDFPPFLFFNGKDIMNVLMLLLVFTISISGCNEKNAGGNVNTSVELNESINIGFESIDIGSSNTMENISGPKIFVINNTNQLKSFANWNKELIDKLKQIDYDKHTVVAIFRGQMQSSGFGIAVKDLKSENNKIIIMVNLTNPSGQAVQPVISYPYHIIGIPKENMKNILEVYTDNNEILTSVGLVK